MEAKTTFYENFFSCSELEQQRSRKKLWQIKADKEEKPSTNGLIVKLFQLPPN
jgi:hypothetical protein